MKKHCFTQEERIKKNTEIQEIRNTGRKVFGKFYYIIYNPNRLGHNRIAALVSKKKLGAVNRNYERRIIREIYRQNKEILKQTIDVLIVKKKYGTNCFKEKQEDLKKLFELTQH